MAKKIWISVGLAVVVLWVIGVLIWLANQPPVLGRSEEKDPLSGRPKQVTLNPIRDRAPERSAEKVLTAMRDGHCREQLADWLKGYRRTYATFICNAEQQHPLVSWTLVDRDEQPPLVIMQYQTVRKDGSNTYQEDLWLTAKHQDNGAWEMTKYGAMY